MVSIIWSVTTYEKSPLGNDQGNNTNSLCKENKANKVSRTLELYSKWVEIISLGKGYNMPTRNISKNKFYLLDDTHSMYYLLINRSFTKKLNKKQNKIIIIILKYFDGSGTKFIN